MASGSVTISRDSIERRFAELKAARRRALVPYITAGHPDAERTIELLQGLARRGRRRDRAWPAVLGSDGGRADHPGKLAARARAGDELRPLARTGASRAACSVPLVLFSYLNPVIAAGADALTRAAEAGFCGHSAHRPAGRLRSRARSVGRRWAARVHSPRRADDAARAHARDRGARQRVRLPDQPARRHGRARRSAARAARRRWPDCAARRRCRCASASACPARNTPPRSRGSPTASSSAARSSAPPARASRRQLRLLSSLRSAIDAV